MSEKYLSVKIEPERLIGICLKAIANNENVNLTISTNPGESQGNPDFVNQLYGIAIWVRDSKF